MPEMNGLDVIIELTCGLLDATVIAIGGHADARSTLSNTKLLGARHVLDKPFSLTTFLSLVRYELGH